MAAEDSTCSGQADVPAVALAAADPVPDDFAAIAKPRGRGGQIC
jgi:hypothetical protein